MRLYRRTIRVLFAAAFIGGGASHFLFGRLMPDSYAAFAGTALLRRLLTVEQYREPDAAARYHDYFIARPLAFQTELFRSLLATGDFREGLDPEQVALAFFGPIHLLIGLAENDERRAGALLAGHIRHFRRTHLREA